MLKKYAFFVPVLTRSVSFFIYSVMRCYHASPQAICFLFMMTPVLFSACFHPSKTFECVSYEFSVATSTRATTTCPSYKYERMISSLRSPSRSRKTALAAFFHRGPRSGLPTAPLWKRSKLLCFASWIIKNRVFRKEYPCLIQHSEKTKLKTNPVKNGPSLSQTGHVKTEKMKLSVDLCG